MYRYSAYIPARPLLCLCVSLCLCVMAWLWLLTQATFNHIKQWMVQIEKHTEDAARLIVGNKCDLVADRVVAYNTGKVGPYCLHGRIIICRPRGGSSSAPTGGGDTRGCEWGLGGRLSWSWIEKKGKKMDSNGGCAPPTPPLLDPPLRLIYLECCWG